MNANATTAAPTVRKKAIGHRSSAIGDPGQPPAALGHDSQNTSSPEAAKESGGVGKAHQLLGEQLPKLLDELNEVLAA
jgi:hypothetical protein